MHQQATRFLWALVFSLPLALSGCGLFQVPEQEIQTFVDGWAQVKNVHDAFLEQYAQDVIDSNTENQPAGNRGSGRYPGLLPDILEPGAAAAPSTDIAARAQAVNVINQYNTILLAIRDNVPLTQTRHLANKLGGLLLVGVKAGVSALGIPGGVIEPIVARLKAAKTRVEIMRALNKAKISVRAHTLLLKSKGDPNSAAAKELAELPESEIPCQPVSDAQCVSLIIFALELMRIDANAFYEVRNSEVFKRRGRLTSQLARLGLRLKNHLHIRQEPAADSELTRKRDEADREFNLILAAFGQQAFSFPHNPNGQPYDQGSADFVENALVAARALDARDAEFGAGLHEYQEAILHYRDVLLPHTANYFVEIEVALTRAPDILGVNSADGDTIIPLAEKLINGSIDVRTVIRTAVGLQ